MEIRSQMPGTGSRGNGVGIVELREMNSSHDHHSSLFSGEKLRVLCSKLYGRNLNRFQEKFFYSGGFFQRPDLHFFELKNTY